MNPSSVHPSSLVGIKRLAKSIKRDKGISHAEALDAASQAGAFHNFRHARHQLSASKGAGPCGDLHPIYLTAYWRDEDGTSGRETLTIRLPKELAAIGSAAKITQAVRHFKVDAEDHLECRNDIRSQVSARELICHAARTLAFMAVGGLVPAGWRHRTISRLIHGMPRRDHTTHWVHAESRTHVVSDEPYDDERLLDVRAPWLAERGLHCNAPAWPGMYSPGRATMFLTSNDAEVIAQVAKRLSRCTNQPIADRWAGESAAYAPSFVSPARAASGKRKYARPQPIVAGVERNGALPFAATPFGNGVEWRPAVKMPIKDHAEIGAILKTLIEQQPAKSSIMASVERLRSTLDEWVQREYSPSELPGELFTELYYGAVVPALPGGLTPKTAIARIARLLRESYNDCVPLRAMLRKFSTIERAMANVVLAQNQP